MKKSIIHFLYLLIAISISSCSLKNNEDYLSFSISYVKDLEKVETINTVLAKEFIPLKNKKFGVKNGTYWFKVTLNEKAIPKKIVFDLPESDIDKITIYQNAKIVNYKQLDNTHFSLLVNTDSQNSTYYLKATFSHEVFFPLDVKVHNKAQLSEKYDFFTNGIYYGFVLMIIITNIFFYFSLKDITFLFYSFFVIAINIGVLDYDGLLAALLPNSHYFKFIYFSNFLVALFGALFANQFLNIQYYIPKANHIGFYLIAFALGNYILFIPFNQYVFIAIANTTSLFVLLHYWIIGVIILKKYKFARFFVIGYCLVLFSAFLFVIPLDWGLETYAVSLNTIKFGALFEMLILTYAITYRIKILQEENDNYRKEISNYLDEIKILQNTSDENTFKIEEEVLKSTYNLSEKEIEVLLLIYKGFTNKRIGKDLDISLNTVKYHIRNIYEKLNISSKNEVIDIVSKI